MAAPAHSRPRERQAGLARRALLLGCLLLAGCASLPTDYERSPSTFIGDTGDTELGRFVGPLAEANPGKSGFYLLSDGLDAFAARLVLAELAERSLDVQYYFIIDDMTGNVFAERLLDAADRGVRVRLLLDDMATKGYDPGLAALDSHPNMEVRLFNPFARRSGRFVDMVTDFDRINRRMHNKSFTADNQVTIVGGRNIADEYFRARGDLDFGDLDLLALGPVVTEVSTAFDAYWNSEASVPVTAITGGHPPPETLDALRLELRGHRAAARDSAYKPALETSDFMQRASAGELPFFWGPARLAYDLPEKVLAHPDETGTHMGSQISGVFEGAEEELLVVSPYFVPMRSGVEFFEGLVQRGVRVIIVTNSLAATDVAVVHAGYAPYREALLRVGVELYEVKPDVDFHKRQRGPIGASRSSLHAKAFAVDRRWLFVGSPNLDPRSDKLNTEMGILVEHPEVATQAVEEMLDELQDLAYAIRLGADGRLEWVTVVEGREVVYHDEPGAGFWRRVLADFLGMFPIEEQL